MDLIILGTMVMIGFRIGIEVERYASGSGSQMQQSYDAGYEAGWNDGRYEGARTAREETIKQIQESVRRSVGL